MTRYSLATWSSLSFGESLFFPSSLVHRAFIIDCFWSKNGSPTQSIKEFRFVKDLLPIFYNRILYRLKCFMIIVYIRKKTKGIQLLFLNHVHCLSLHISQVWWLFDVTMHFNNIILKLTTGIAIQHVVCCASPKNDRWTHRDNTV